MSEIIYDSQSTNYEGSPVETACLQLVRNQRIDKDLKKLGLITVRLHAGLHNVYLLQWIDIGRFVVKVPRRDYMSRVGFPYEDMRYEMMRTWYTNRYFGTEIDALRMTFARNHFASADFLCQEFYGKPGFSLQNIIMSAGQATLSAITGDTKSRVRELYGYLNEVKDLCSHESCFAGMEPDLYNSKGKIHNGNFIDIGNGHLVVVDAWRPI